MQLPLLEIENFRGARSAKLRFLKNSVLIGAKNCVKTTIVEAIALVLGRDRQVRDLTEHDFCGSDPQAESRIRITEALTGFDPDDFTPVGALRQPS